MKAVFISGKIQIGMFSDTVHHNHTIPNNIEDIQSDVWKPYAVFESCTNYPFIHGVMADSKDHALEQVAEVEGVRASDLIGVEQLEF